MSFLPPGSQKTSPDVHARSIHSPLAHPESHTVRLELPAASHCSASLESIHDFVLGTQSAVMHWPSSQPRAQVRVAYDSPSGAHISKLSPAHWTALAGQIGLEFGVMTAGRPQESSNPHATRNIVVTKWRVDTGVRGADIRTVYLKMVWSF